MKLRNTSIEAYSSPRIAGEPWVSVLPSKGAQGAEYAIRIGAFCLHIERKKTTPSEGAGEVTKGRPWGLLNRDPMAPWIKAGRFIFDVQRNPRLEGEPQVFAMRYRNSRSDTLQVRFGPILVFLEREKKTVPAPAE